MELKMHRYAKFANRAYDLAEELQAKGRFTRSAHWIRWAEYWARKFMEVS
jgi:hypothetical protein